MSIWLLTMIMTTSCSKKTIPVVTSSMPSKPTLAIIDIDTVSLPTPCEIAGPVISRAKSFVGTVLYYGHPEYHGNTGLYCIIYTVPNTTDSQLFGYVCNMPDDFKKSGLKVLFSGEYYHAYKDIKPTGHDGQALLYLRLKSLRAL